MYPLPWEMTSCSNEVRIADESPSPRCPGPLESMQCCWLSYFVRVLTCLITCLITCLLCAIEKSCHTARPRLLAWLLAAATWHGSRNLIQIQSDYNQIANQCTIIRANQCRINVESMSTESTVSILSTLSVTKYHQISSLSGAPHSPNRINRAITSLALGHSQGRHAWP